MSRNILEKLANEEELDDDDIAYARDRGIKLPEEYGPGPESMTEESEGPARPQEPVVQGKDFGPESEESADELEQLTKAELKAMAEERGLDVPSGSTKQDIIDLLTGEEPEDEEE